MTSTDLAPVQGPPPEPGRIERLSHDKHGRAVPWFVAWIDGVPDHRIIKPGAASMALDGRWCWTCGIPFQRQEYRAFVIGPMCAVNHLSSEPPSHPECARYSVQVCPFLTTPRMTRRDRHLPPGTTLPAGHMIMRNPGVVLVWIVGYNTWGPLRAPDGLLFDIGDPVSVEWWSEGRAATRGEAEASLDSGLPELRKLAKRQGPAAYATLNRRTEAARLLLPSA